LKKFFAKSFLGIPMLAIVVAVVVTMSAVAFMAVSLRSDTAEMTVVEQITISDPVISAGGGAFAAGVWSDIIDPNETNTATFTLTNAGTTAITVTATVTPPVGVTDPACTFDAPTYTVPAKVGAVDGTIDAIATMTASNSVPVGGPYVFGLDFTR
jgi:phage baseplate assembly protein gpV